ncbi:helix-turn-helix transcriptional regulator [Leptolyngbya sp. FACHB-36]|uniref:helix-turn-helix transcriptional regulator n=1 Tax=Leptolyngbya sp. FACHB-36 TaxID=2692808 RepID=UPI0016805805|nr:AraC family transcriptional regulator [Leptolyngbya sp. FACHB-36]MBD2022675.1 helix-turn-helix transcriptional regulator [Leptolyngbya sp. FACHB-36]
MTLSSINLIDPETGQRFPSAPDSAVVLSSTQAKWRQNLTLEVQRLLPMELPEHQIEGHRLIINLGEPVRFGWCVDGRSHERVLPAGGLCLQSEGETNAPFWRDEMTVAAISIAPEFVITLLEDRAPTALETFAERRCVPDSQSYIFTRALASELATPSEPLYAETLTMAFTLHLLTAHSQNPKKPLIPKGKLSALQLKTIVELAHEQLGDDLGLAEMARVVGVSPFHFARLFKNTTGFAPHQFVLHLRLERAKRLLVTHQLSLPDVAQAVGFFDQAHFTNAFRRAFGVTPKAFAKTLKN